MITGKKLALVVEDDENWQGNFVKSLKRKDFEVLQATNLKDAEESYSSNSDKIDLIVMDGCLGSDSPNTPDLIKLIRKKLKKSIYAKIYNLFLNKQTFLQHPNIDQAQVD